MSVLPRNRGNHSSETRVAFPGQPFQLPANGASQLIRFWPRARQGIKGELCIIRWHGDLLREPNRGATFTCHFARRLKRCISVLLLSTKRGCVRHLRMRGGFDLRHVYRSWNQWKCGAPHICTFAWPWTITFDLLTSDLHDLNSSARQSATGVRTIRALCGSKLISRVARMTMGQGCAIQQ